MASLAQRRSFMKLALAEAARGIDRGDGGPFGACVVKGTDVVATGHNEVLKTNDPTRHAEVCAITRAARKIGSPHFDGCEIYSTTEPCVMCFAAIHWARVRKIYFGTTVRDVQKLGFNELSISNRRLRTLGGSRVRIEPAFLRQECLELLERWRDLGLSVY